MSLLKLSKSESRWLSLISFFSLVIVGFFFVQPILPDIAHKNEPLADTTSLTLLQSGAELPVPEEESEAEFLGNTVSVPNLAALQSTQLGVLGHSSLERHIEVDLTNQRLYAIEGGQKVYEFPVSTGKWAPTPAGEFTIWAKVKSQKMSGGQGADYYYLPNVPWVQFFYNNDVAKSRGFSLHGTYWHNNFGYPMSHGCVNMRIEDAATIFAWTDPVVTDPKAWSTNATADNPGTKIIIYGEAPKE